MHSDKRPAHELRKTVITPHYLEQPEGSVLIESGRTKVICTASVEDRVPPFLRGTGKGWITAEWRTSELGRRAKFYSLTRLGRRQLEKQAADWARLSSAITHVVRLEEV